MAAIRFYLNPDKKGSAKIMAAFQEGNKCPTKYLGYNVSCAKTGDDYKYWNKKASRVRSIEPKMMAEINDKITSWENAFNTYISQCNLASSAPDVYLFKATLVGTLKTNINKPGTLMLSAIVQWFIDSIETSRDEGTKRKYNTLQTNIFEFDVARKKETAAEGVNKSWYKEFAQYLIDTEDNYNSMINKKQVQLITIINDFLKNSSEAKIYRPLLLEYKNKYKLKEVAANKFPLYPEEVASLRAFTGFKTDYQRMVVDAFLVACDTGLRVSDAQQLKPIHMHTHIDVEGIINYISLINIKGSKQNDMAVPERAMAILQKYITDDNKCMFKFDYSQSVSRILKEVFAHEDLNLNRQCEVVTAQGLIIKKEILPLYDVISFHTARNTYITTCNNNGLPIAFTQKNAGHGDIKTTMIYQRDQSPLRWRETLRALK